MAGLVYQLLELLNEQAERYGELLGLSREKKDVIIANDVEALQKITHLENMIVSQNQKLEKKRLEIVKDMAMVLNQPAGNLTINAVIELMQGQDEQQLLIEARDKIKAVLDLLTDINAQNALLIQNALDYIEYSLNVMHSSISQTPSYYSSTGERLIDEPGFFDSKN